MSVADLFALSICITVADAFACCSMTIAWARSTANHGLVHCNSTVLHHDKFSRSDRFRGDYQISDGGTMTAHFFPESPVILLSSFVPIYTAAGRITILCCTMPRCDMLETCGSACSTGYDACFLYREVTDDRLKAP